MAHDDYYDMDYDEQEERSEKVGAAELSVEDILDSFANGVNIAELLDKETLRKVGYQVCETYEADKDSLDEWLEGYKSDMKLAMQVAEPKNFPWPGAANVKLPILTVAAQQFAARAGPALVKMPQPVRGIINGYKTDEKVAAADRIGKHLSYQVTQQMDGWIEEHDRLVHTIPITGCCYKKTYRDTTRDVNVSELVLADRLVFDFYCDGVESARDITHWFYKHKQEILEYQNSGFYIDCDISGNDSDSEDDFELREDINGQDEPQEDGKRQYCRILEQHTWCDLDGDGYEEPYIITVEAATQKVLRIAPRYGWESIQWNEDIEDIVRIKPDRHFTEYLFLPDPSGGNRGIGWGFMLRHMTKTANTLVNQLLDNGTLNNLGGGIMDKMLNIEGGELKRGQGTWNRVNGHGMDLRQSIVPWPTNEPSQVLFMLLQTVIGWAQKITAVSDAMAGETPVAGTPATTTLAMLEQGQKVFQGIYARLFRSMSKEFKKLYDLNKKYMADAEYFQVLDMPVADQQQAMQMMQIGMQVEQPGVVYRNDYMRDDTDIMLSAEQTIPSEQIAMARLRLLMEVANAGFPINPEYMEMQIIRSLGLPDSERGRVMGQQQPPQPPPQVQTKAMEIDFKQKAKQVDAVLERRRQDIDAERVKTEQQRIKAQYGTKARDDSLKHARESEKIAIDETALALQHMNGVKNDNQT